MVVLDESFKFVSPCWLAKLQVKSSGEENNCINCIFGSSKRFGQNELLTSVQLINLIELRRGIDRKGRTHLLELPVGSERQLSFVQQL
jgi:hypothetical protein